MVKLKIENETKEEKFKRIAATRTRKILRLLKLLGNCANKSSYEYTEADIKKIFSTIDNQLKETKAKFNTDKSREFTL